MITRMHALALSATLALAACTHPADVSRPLTEVEDKNAHFTVKDVPAGVTVEARHSRYQFVPETSALITICRQLATARAYDEAERRGREIEPINDQTVRVSTGRNIVTARTSCRVFVEAKFKQ